MTAFSAPVIATIQSLDALQRQINAALATMATQCVPGYGTALPDPAAYDDGKLFVLTTGPTLYQLQGGSWAACGPADAVVWE